MILIIEQCVWYRLRYKYVGMDVDMIYIYICLQSSTRKRFKIVFKSHSVLLYCKECFVICSAIKGATAKQTPNMYKCSLNYYIIISIKILLLLFWLLCFDFTPITCSLRSPEPVKHPTSGCTDSVPTYNLVYHSKLILERPLVVCRFII